MMVIVMLLMMLVMAVGDVIDDTNYLVKLVT
jgi:hypothetical protein